MKKLIAFGDSWTAGHGVEDDNYYKENPTPPGFIQKLREQNSWVRYCAEKFDIPYVNLGVCGYGNEYIYQSIKDNLEFISKEDLIIVVFSYPHRYQSYNKYKPVELFQKFEELLDGYTKFYFNGFYPLLENTKELPVHYINPDGTLSYQLEIEEIINKKNVWEYGSKMVWNDKDNYYEGDYHPNLEGYKIISQYIYNEITQLL